MQKHSATTETMKAKLDDRIAEVDAYLGGDLQRASMRDQYTLYLLLQVKKDVGKLADTEAAALLTEAATGDLWALYSKKMSFHEFCDGDGQPLLFALGYLDA